MEKKLSFISLSSLLAELSREELTLLSVASRESGGVTFGEIEKSLRYDTGLIEELSKNLSRRMLTYVLKNRQRLHNKLDKIYLRPEVRDILNPLDAHALSGYLGDALGRLKHGGGSVKPLPGAVRRHSESRNLIRVIFERGGIVSLEEARKLLTPSSLERVLKELQAEGVLAVRHDLDVPARTYVLLSAELYPALVREAEDSAPPGATFVHNRYHFLLNLLVLFDVISSSGLFLTKQREFRKIDRKRIVESTLTLFDHAGEPFDADMVFQLCLSVFDRLKCLGMKRDAVILSLKALRKDLESPVRLLMRIMKSLQAEETSGLFSPPFPLPSYETLTALIDLVAGYREIPVQVLYTSFMLQSLRKIGDEEARSLEAFRDSLAAEFAGGIKLLFLLGLAEVRGGKLRLSDVGTEALSRLGKGKKSPADKKEQDTKLVYINPDFTLIIPKNEIPSEATYHLLAHTHVIKDDVILHARIERASIVKANKRGMTQAEFLAVLQRYARNEIPQNMSFLLAEWAQQTVQLSISEVMVLHSSHPSLIDELAFAELPDGVLQKISPNHAIVDRRHLDTLLRILHKKDAVLSLFEDDGDAD